MGVQHMQGVPVQLEYLHDTEKKRRHLSRCKNIIKPDKVCDCPESPYFNKRCRSASRCEYYAEK